MALLKDLIVSGQTKLLGNLNVTGDIVGNLAGTAEIAKTADKLGGFALTTNGKTGIPYITSNNGVIEIGQYIDFHESGSNLDYDNRIASDKDAIRFVSGNATNGVSTLIASFSSSTGKVLINENTGGGVIKLFSSSGNSSSEIDCNNEKMRLVWRSYSPDKNIVPIIYDGSTNKTTVLNAVDSSGNAYLTGATANYVPALTATDVQTARTRIPSNVDIIDYLTKNAKIGHQYFRTGKESGQTNVPANSAGWAWFVYDGLNYHANVMVNNYHSTKYILDHVNYANGWTEIPTLDNTGLTIHTGYEPYVVGVTTSQSNTLGFKASFLVVATGANTASCTTSSNGFVTINSTGFSFASAPSQAYGYIAFR